MKFTLLLILIISCEDYPRRDLSSNDGNQYQTDSSYCAEAVQKGICDNENDQEIQDFKTRCMLENKKIINCNCEEYLCVDEESTNDTLDEPEVEGPIQSIPSPNPSQKVGMILDDWQNEYTGIDYNGNERTCSPLPPDVACFTVFTKEDEYGSQCRQEGKDIVFCNCHDPICLN